MYKINDCHLYISIACILSPCPPGSICRVCNDTREAYCVYTCADDNGGCDPGNRCIEVNVPTCSPDQCCSPVNITCQSMLIMGCVSCIMLYNHTITIVMFCMHAYVFLQFDA